MSDRRWERLEEAFARAVERPEEEWEAVVAEACGDDLRLRAEVMELLRGMEPSARFMDRLAARIGLPREEPEGGREEGAEPAMGRVGPYRLTRLLGRGGMGVVYLGEREADGFRLEAAIKVVATGFESESARERFLRERRILAGLRHPHIASLFDGGFSEEGAPYFVMEYVEGDPIHRFCDQRRLTVRQRVELFLQVVAAVEHAHQNLVIHRDLKPQNVLVTSQGQAKLLDFGIARLLDAGSEEFHTATALPNPMTVAYASPEQIRGRTLSTATDVYGLGLLLYQLVTGRLPYELDGASAGEAERIICTTEPLPPHRAPAGAPSVTGSGDA
ncbi:MAG TPA: serine/threonine-protein kinase, partial [Longimicrobiales bacterium]|nr:serine/threonine-protein kinase [Longimicrobiales bacterium]